METPINKMDTTQLADVLSDLCAQHDLKLDNTSEGYEICQNDGSLSRRFIWETVDSFGLDFSNTDESGLHAIRVLHANGYDEYNTNTLKKNLRNAIRLLQSDMPLFEKCAGCENCDYENIQVGGTSTTSDEEQMIIEAMIEHGTPNWVASVPSRVRRSVPATRIAELREQYASLSESIANKRDTKHDLIDEWCKENVFAEVTLADLAQIGNCSKEFARQKTIARPDIFRRLTHRTFEIRDPQADRRAS